MDVGRRAQGTTTCLVPLGRVNWHIYLVGEQL